MTIRIIDFKRMEILRKLILIAVFPCLLIYGAYLVKCRLGIDVDEYHHAGDYTAAIAHPDIVPGSSGDMYRSNSVRVPGILK